jgi:phosphoribosylcarboxyaminoimidazole (NCAIR) mutase
MPDIRFVLGSETDAKEANELLKVWNRLSIKTEVSIASCHWHAGDEGDGFEKFIKGIAERIIVFIGGMSLAAPGIIETINKVNGCCEKIVFAVPTDQAARSAIEDVPKGTALLTSGLNTVSLNHSLFNSAVAVAKLAFMAMPKGRAPEAAFQLRVLLSEIRQSKPIVEKIKLANGLIPLPQPKK